jgi:hypothetical protein
VWKAWLRAGGLRRGDWLPRPLTSQLNGLSGGEAWLEEVGIWGAS